MAFSRCLIPAVDCGGFGGSKSRLTVSQVRRVQSYINSSFGLDGSLQTSKKAEEENHHHHHKKPKPKKMDSGGYSIEHLNAMVDNTSCGKF